MRTERPAPSNYIQASPRRLRTATRIRRHLLVGLGLAAGFCAASLSFPAGFPSGRVGRQVAAADSVELQRQRIQALADREKDELRRKLERFHAMSPQEQQRIRQLHADLESDPQGAQLRQILERYNGWLRTLTPTQTAELVDLPVDERIKAIKSQLQKQEMLNVGPLAGAKLKSSDVEAIVSWLDDFIQRNEATIRSEMPRESFGDFEHRFLSRIEDPKRRRLVLYSSYLRRPPSERTVRPSEDDLRQLQAKLSGEAQAELARAGEPAARLALFQSWLRVVIFSKTMPQVSREQLQTFMNQRLSPQDREYLEGLPVERVWGELNRMYFKDKFERTPPYQPGSRGFGDGRGRNESGSRSFGRRGNESDNGPPPPPPSTPDSKSD